MAVVRKDVQLDEKNVAAFERHFPKSSLSWALDLLLEKFVEQYTHTPEEYAALASQELKEEISK